MSVVNLNHDIDGMLLAVPLPLAEKMLTKHDDGSTIYISAMNGADLFVKEDDKVRVSTDAEWKSYFEKKEAK